MLSRKLDSNIISAILAQYVHHLLTYNVTYENQNIYFQVYNYQTTIVTHYQNLHYSFVGKQTHLLDIFQKVLTIKNSLK